MEAGPGSLRYVEAARAAENPGKVNLRTMEPKGTLSELTCELTMTPTVVSARACDRCGVSLQRIRNVHD